MKALIELLARLNELGYKVLCSLGHALGLPLAVHYVMAPLSLVVLATLIHTRYRDLLRRGQRSRASDFAWLAWFMFVLMGGILWFNIRELREGRHPDFRLEIAALVVYLGVAGLYGRLVWEEVKAWRRRRAPRGEEGEERAVESGPGRDAEDT
jgi:apolipoprotein N-acyltransferase